jgi:DUF4097 and DUF4098 domain-containing protein YvlB
MTTEDTMHTFETPGPVSLRVELWQGEVDVTAEDTQTTTVELIPAHGDPGAQDIIDNAKVEQRGDEIVVLMPKVKSGLFRRGSEITARIVVPKLSRARIETASADIATHGELGDVRAASGSGEVAIDQADDVEVRTGSGDIRLDAAKGSVSTKSGSAEVVVGKVNGDCDVLSGSGAVAIDEVGGMLKVKAGSGDIVVQAPGRGVDAMSGSGDLVFKRVEHGRVKAKTGSGDVTVGVANGTAAYLDVTSVTGDVSSELDGAEAPTDDAPTAEILVQTGSGDVVLQRA